MEFRIFTKLFNVIQHSISNPDKRSSLSLALSTGSNNLHRVMTRQDSSWDYFSIDLIFIESPQALWPITANPSGAAPLSSSSIQSL